MIAKSSDAAEVVAGRTIGVVQYLPVSGGFFQIQMTNGTSYLLPKDTLEEADSSEVLSWAVSDDGEYFEVKQASGSVFEVPWDDVLYHCESSYEYFKGRSKAWQNEDPEERALRIGGRIRDLRMERAISVSEAARRIGMQRSNLSRVESGKHLPSLETLEKIAEALDVPVARLIAK